MPRALRLRVVFVGLTCLIAPAALGADSADPEDERIERIIELQERRTELGEELETLIGDLSPEARGRLEARMRGDDSTVAAPESRPEEVGKTTAGRSPTEIVAPERPSRPEATVPDVQEPHEPTASCGTLSVLDSNGDGWVSGADRFWRYLGLWRDNGDGVVADSEVKSLFKHGIRSVGSSLYSYRGEKDLDGGVWVEETIYFDLPGRRSRATLTINAGSLGRSGELRLEAADGAPLDGTQPLGAGMFWVSSSGERTPVICRPG